MKITKKMFKSFEGLEKLEKMQKEGYCIGWTCSKCPLKDSNINGNINGNKIDCEYHGMIKEDEVLRKSVEWKTGERIRIRPDIIYHQRSQPGETGHNFFYPSNVYITYCELFFAAFLV